MAWNRADDGVAFHPQVLGLGRAAARGADQVRLVNLAWGAFHRMTTWTAEHETDGWLDDTAAAMICGPDLDAIVKACRQQKLILGRQRHPDHGHGWLLDVLRADGLLHNRSREETRAGRPDKIPTTIRLRVLARDGDRCRYCRIFTSPHDRKGGTLTTLDHIDPDGPTTVDNLAVACRTCNSEMAGWSLAEKLAKLQPTPGDHDEPLNLHPTTRTRLEGAGLIPASASPDAPHSDRATPTRPVEDQGPAETPSTATADDSAAPGAPRPGSDTDQTPIKGAEPGIPRVGSGRVGSPSRSSPRSGSRGGRRRRKPRTG